MSPTARSFPAPTSGLQEATAKPTVSTAATLDLAVDAVGLATANCWFRVDKAGSTRPYAGC